MTIDDAYDFCRAVAHKHGANFSVGFRFLPRVKRRAVYAAYAYCRFADDLVDEEWAVGGGRWAEAQTEVPASAHRPPSTAHRLDSWQHELDEAYAGSPTHPITIALADALRHFVIPKSAFVALIDGCRQDLVKFRYETFEELLHYCELVAASIS